MSFFLFLLKSLSRESFPELVDRTYNGVIFFLSFGIKEANDIEKSLGKMVMSLLALGSFNNYLGRKGWVVSQMSTLISVG